MLPNWYGETLFATPFLKALWAHQPDAFIATLGWPSCREILLGNPRINAILDYDERGVHRGLRGRWRLIGMLRAQHFDVAFILRKSLSRSLMLAFAGIPTRIGFANPKSGWLLTHRVPPADRLQHKASSYLSLLQAIGGSARVDTYEYAVSDAERECVQAQMYHLQLGDGKPIIVLHPGANWPHKRWPPERFALLGDQLAAQHGAHLLVTGGPDDVVLAESIQRQMRHPVTVLAGQTTLRQLAAWLELAHVVISNDTGVLHLAAALGRPVIALYGPTSPVLTGPLGDPSRIVVLHHPTCCPEIPCYQPDHPQYPGMNAIMVDEVYGAATRLLEAHV